MDIQFDKESGLRIALQGAKEVDEIYGCAESGLQKKKLKRFHRRGSQADALKVLERKSEELVLEGEIAELCVRGLANYAIDTLKYMANPMTVIGKSDIETIERVTDFLARVNVVRYLPAHQSARVNTQMEKYFPAQAAGA